ncbi:hypothetical protein ATY31_24620 [Sinorhizobium americanum]|uniref:Uncharacterized protein n=1 Tax=Sinorhizobium americanum TaxID=194963 RepID=A0A2S3YHK4_9HYPH|nr:hypothetical protein ATY31_24620 [Sinorhizobium americanum]
MPISPLVGEMPGRAEGGEPRAHHSNVPFPITRTICSHTFVNVAQHVVIPETQDSPASGLQSERTLPIVVGITRFRMLRTIDFDDQSMCGASEIDDITRDRNLSAKAEAHQSM